MHATYTQPTRTAENRAMTASTVMETLRRRMAGAAGTLLAIALLLGMPSSGWAQRVLVINLIDIQVCENIVLDDCDTTASNAANYTVNLSTVPTGTVTVALAVESDHPKPPTVNKELLTFALDNWSVAQAITVTGIDDDVDNPGGFRLATIKHTATGGGFSTNKTVHVAVENDGDAAGITLSEIGTAVTVTEGGTDGSDNPSDSYTVELDSEPTGTVTVSLKVGGRNPDAATVEPAALTFTPDDWDDAQPVTVTGVPDDSAEDRTAMITHTPTGGSYENVSAPTKGVVIRNLGRTDQTERGVIFDPPSLVIDEGGTGAYTIRLTSSPGTNNAEVTLDIPEPRSVIERTSLGQGKLTFTDDDWDEPQQIEVTVKDNPVSQNYTAEITHSFTNYSITSGTTLTVTAQDKNMKGLFVSDRALTFGENSFRRYSVKLTSKPTEDVTVTITGGESTVANVTDKDGTALSVLNFPVDDWNNAQTVFVRGVDDAVRHPGGRSVTIIHTASSSGDYTGVDPVPVPVEVEITDVDDDPEIKISDFPPESSIPDDGEVATLPSYTVGLSTSPSVEVTVKLEMESVKGSDGLSDGANCASPEKSIELTFSVQTAPAVDDPDPQEVKICVGDNEDSPGSSRRVTITHTASGGEYSDVSAVRKLLTVTDDEDHKEGISAKLRISRVEGFSVSEDGGTADGYGTPVPYTVRLDSNDSTDRTVTLADYSTDIKVTSSQTASEDPVSISDPPVSLSFMSTESVHTVYVIGVNDDVVGSRSTSIVHTVVGVDSYNPIEVPITVNDRGDTAGLLITKTETGDEIPRPVINENDGMSTYYVRLRSSPPPAGEVVVHVISREPSSVDVTTPSSKKLTFTHTGGASPWDDGQMVTVTGKDDSVDNSGGRRSAVITHTPERSGYGYNQRKDITVTIKDQDSDVAGITVEKPLSEVYEGEEGTFTTRLSAAPQVGKIVTMRVASDSSKATARPSSLTFTHANWRLAQTVYVTGVSGSHEGVDTEVTLTPSGGNYGARAKKVQFVVLRSTDPGLRVDPQQLEVSEGGTATYTVELNTDPGQTVTVSILSGSILTVSPKILTFTGGDDGNWDTPQTITVTGREDTLIGDRSTTITHAAADYSSDGAEVRVKVTDNDATVTFLQPR